MAIGTHQHKRSFIEREDMRLWKVDDFDRYTTLSGGAYQTISGWRVRSQTEQHERPPEQIKRRATVGEDSVRRTRTGPDVTDRASP